MGKFLEPLAKVKLDKKQKDEHAVQAYLLHHVFPNKYNPHMGKKQLEKAARRANAVL